MNPTINHVAIWVLVIVDQLIGFGWYAAWGEVWLRFHARTMTDIESPHDFTPYCVAIVAAIFVNYSLAWLIARLNATRAVAGLRIALLCWFAFLFVEHATVAAFSAFGTNPWPLVMIDMGRALLCFAVGGLVLGAWQRRVAA